MQYDRSRLPEIAALTHVWWIEPYVAPRIQNDVAAKITGVDLVAPGTNILSARSHHPAAAYAFAYDGDYAYQSGTSQAAPLVSGAAALVRQWYDEQHDTTPSAALLRATLIHGATDFPSDRNPSP
jgi:subtilisin family serine protease